MIFEIFLEFVLAVSVEEDVFLGKVLNFIRCKIDVIFFNSSNFTDSNAIFSFFSLIIDNPVDMEILDAAHYGLNKVEDHFAFTISASTENSPKLS